MSILLKGKYYLGLLLAALAAVVLVRAEERYYYATAQASLVDHSAALGVDGLGLVEGE